MAWELPEGGVLGIFAKQPQVGQVKTRLAVEVGVERAAEIAEALLFDTLDVWSQVGGLLAPGGRKVLVFAPAEAGPWFDMHVPAEFALQPQVEGDLGQRMSSFILGEMADGAGKVVLMGADSPTLDPTFLVSAFLLLDHKDVVLCPATDGGFVLLGVKAPFHPSILEGINWSTSGVLAQTVANIKKADHTLALLPPWYDVDTPESWQMLRGHVLGMLAAGKEDAIGPRLALLLELDEQHASG